MAASSPAAVTTVNPTTGADLRTHALLDAAGRDAALGRAAEAFERHRRTPLAARVAALGRLAGLLEQGAEAHARRMAEEMGKPLAQARAEARKCAAACRYYAEHGPAALADRPRETAAGARAAVVYEPLGPVLAVMPWNFPYWQVLRFAAPALLLGNTVVLKHAPGTFGCAEALAALAEEAGFGPDALLHFPVDVDAVADTIADARVAGVTLTGSEAAGRAVGAAAGRALKPSVLELGGADAFVVLADADLARAVETGVRARVQNNGQSCIAAKRFIVEAPVAEAFAARFAEAMAALRVGDPLDEAHDVGPLARRDLRATVHDQVTRAAAEGARVLTGGAIPEGPGFYYPPTVLAGVAEDSVAFREEIFGPVAAVTVARDADDALRLANATRFGLGGAVFTADAARGARFARAMRCGSAFVNAMTQSHPAMPFGGVGDSGYGRELGPEGLYAFANVKTLWVEP